MAILIFTAASQLLDRAAEDGRTVREFPLEDQISENEKQLGKLLDLYLSGDFEREVLVERRARLEENLENLRREHTETSAYFQQMVITDNQVEDIKAFCLNQLAAF